MLVAGRSCRVQELCESRGGRPGPPVLNKPGGLFLWTLARVQELCESRGGRPGPLVLNKPGGLFLWTLARVQELCESRGGRPGLSVLMSLKPVLNWANVSSRT